MARITRALWMKEFERLTRTITVVIAAGPLIMGIARGKIETSSSWRRSCSSSGVDLARERGAWSMLMAMIKMKTSPAI